SVGLAPQPDAEHEACPGLAVPGFAPPDTSVDWTGVLGSGLLPPHPTRTALVPRAASAPAIAWRDRLGFIVCGSLVCVVLVRLADARRPSQVPPGVARRSTVTSAVSATFVPRRPRAPWASLPKLSRGLTSCSARSTRSGVLERISMAVGLVSAG